MAFPTTSVLDDFNRANGAIGSNWVAGFGDPLPAVNTNSARGAAAGWYGAVWAPSGTPASFGPDCEAYYTIAVANLASAQPAGVLARVSTPTSGTFSGYMARVHSSTGEPELVRFDAGTPTTLDTAIGVTPVAGDKIGLSCIGSTISIWYAPAGVWPGAATKTVTDATYGSAGAICVSINQTGANSNGFDDFGGGTLGAAAAASLPSLRRRRDRTRGLTIR